MTSQTPAVVMDKYVNHNTTLDPGTDYLQRYGFLQIGYAGPFLLDMFLLTDSKASPVMMLLHSSFPPQSRRKAVPPEARAQARVVQLWPTNHLS